MDAITLPDPATQPTISVPEAGRILSLSHRHSYIAAARGDFPTIRVGGKIRVPTARFLRQFGLDPSD